MLKDRREKKPGSLELSERTSDNVRVGSYPASMVEAVNEEK